MSFKSDYIIEIEESIRKNNKIFTSMGVTNGLAGVSLFYYYLNSKEKASDMKLDFCLHYLEKSIDGLNESYMGSTIVNDILEIGCLLDFYRDKGILSYDDTISYFDNYEPIIESLLIENLDKNILNPVFGVLNFANYFISRKPSIENKYNYLFVKVLDKIEELSCSHKDSEGIYWVSNIKREGEYLIELGIRHGVMGIIDHLVKLYEIGFQRERVFGLIEKALRYVIYYKLQFGKSLFPFSADKTPEKRDFSFGTIYGDLGIAYGLYRAGMICKLPNYTKIGMEVLLNSCEFRDDDNDKITDANLLYGNLGVASLLNLFKKNIDNSILNDSVEYWYNKTEQYKTNNNQWAGFDSTFNKFDINTQLSFGHGIIGIGIALLNFEKELNFDFLSFINYSLPVS
ncbi:lanthionine synthetase LanC family protein [Flavobacterium sp. ZS1P70]|uniref:Lanthionine synthetase LanC family protein n=1 Tax=Flavobacterium zhoui TaxID=3230414 RepID=A0ABW6I8T7_9FLAO